MPARRPKRSLKRACARPRPTLEIDPRLLEMDYGAWEGLTYEEIEATRRRARAAAGRPTRPTLACPDGESGDDVAGRARTFLQYLLAADCPTTGGDARTAVLAVAHSTLNRVLICVALGIPIREFRDRIVQSQVNLTALAVAPVRRPCRRRLLLLNDVAHVRQPPQTPWE